MSITVEQLSSQLGLDCMGNIHMSLDSVANYSNANPSQLTFLATDKKRNEIVDRIDGAVITTPDIANTINAGAVIFSDNPQLSFAKATPLVITGNDIIAHIHKTAVIATSASLDPAVNIAGGVVIEADVQLDAGVNIGANAFVGKGSRIGKNTQIDANVTIYAGTELGEDCQISSGAVIGSPGFGIVPDGDKWLRFPQLGRVIIGDNVDVGANCCIDRGALENTIIGSGVKLDNLIQIAHNVQIGENTVIAACTGIAGSANIGKNCRIGGRASIQGHITIADHVVITTCTFVNKSIFKPGAYSASLSAQENTTWLKNHARLHRLDKMSRQVNKIERQIKRFTDNGEGNDK